MRITRQSLCPCETSVGPLGARKWCGSDSAKSLLRLHLDLHAKVPKEVDAGPPMIPTTPVLPEEQSRTDDHWMQQHADLTRLWRGSAIPLALLA